MKKLLFIFCLIFFFVNVYSLTNAQSARSQCVTTKVGSPSGTPPPLPPGCAGGGGGNDYHFPLRSTDDITSIAQEMGSYSGVFTFTIGDGIDHIEHPALDIMTRHGTRIPVYAITDGEIIFAPAFPERCPDLRVGCTIRIKHSTDTLISVYMHIWPAEAYRPGQHISKGEQIGVLHVWPYNNDHLHFELIEQSTYHNINPRNYFPQLQQFPVSSEYNNRNVREHSAGRGIHLVDDGLEWAEKYLNHPPCLYLGVNNDRDCWAK